MEKGQTWRYQIEAWHEPLRFACLPCPVAEGTQVVVEVEMCGVCHSDLHIRHGPRPGGSPRPLPITMGHEIVGRVVQIGPDVSDVEVGERRVVFPWIGCGHCRACHHDDEVNCLAPRSIGIVEPGGYASHVTVPHSRYLVDPGSIPAEIAATLTCSGLTAFSAIRKLPKLREDDWLVIIGAGGVGLAALGFARNLAPAKIAVIDPVPAKRKIALEMGADEALDPAEVNAASISGNAAAAIDFFGSATTLQSSLTIVRKGGTVIVVGLHGGELPLKVETLVYKNVRLLGSLTGSLSELRELVALSNASDIRSIPITKRPMGEISQALDDLQQGKVIGRLVATNVD